MYRNTKRFILPLLVLILAVPSFAQPGPEMGKSGKARGKMHQGLNLTAEQETQMQDLRFTHEKELIKLKANLQTERLELRQLKQADEPNKKKIYNQIEKVGQERVAMEKAMFDHQIEIKKILTADQYKMFRRHMQAKGKFGDRGKGRHPDGFKRGSRPFHK